jgi:hypothetical protein
LPGTTGAARASLIGRIKQKREHLNRLRKEIESS